MTDVGQHRYDAASAREIERRWQDRWEDDHTFWAPNPTSLLGEGFEAVTDREKLFVLDMFPYPSGVGLHVGHPLGFIGTDVYARFKRMTGFNVLHAMGYDAFGLPAEQYAVQTGRHPRVTTEANIANMARQLRALGLGHDPRRGVATTDVAYYRWTQWIFLQIFNSYYDEEEQLARPIDELIPRLAADPDIGWDDLDGPARRRLVDGHRLAYRSEQPVNWCPALGTVLANEEVTAEGRSERGNHPVHRRPMQQWMLRITAYADRLLADLDDLEWPESTKQMQRNWIGRSTGADVDFAVAGHEGVAITVFTTRPDTLFGATYMVLAPEHPLLEVITATQWPDATLMADVGDMPDAWKGIFGIDSVPSEAVRRYRDYALTKSDLERQSEGQDKTGVFTGAFAVNPTNGESVPIFVADYVMMGYGTGAIMAVPAHDQRDFDFAREFDLPIRGVIRPPDAWFEARSVAPDAAADAWPEAFTGDGVATGSANDDVALDGLAVPEAKATINAWLERVSRGAPTVTYKLRDWLFSRQRYWGEPFPIVYDADDLPIALDESMLPVELPEIDDFAPRIVDDGGASLPDPPLARAESWVTVELDVALPEWAGGSVGPAQYRRELNTMPQWAGSCWYYLRYLDPTNEDEMVSRSAEQYWMGAGPGGGVDLYVGGVEHAVLHLLYARFWHKVLYDLGHVSTIEPFRRLFNQGYIQAYAYTDERGVYVDAAKVSERDGVFYLGDEVVHREYGKMGKSLHNAVTPDDVYDAYGADTLRLYEMFMGPLDASRPWNTTDIVGVYRFLQRLWRNVIDEETGESRVGVEPADPETLRLLHRTIDAVRHDFDTLGFNTAVARLFELNNRLTHVVTENGVAPVEVVTPLVLMVAPLAPHIAEELWSRLGHAESLAFAAFPTADPTLLVDDTVEVPISINGKVRAKIVVGADVDDAAMESAARADGRIAELLAGATVAKVVVVSGRLVNFVTS